MHYIQKRILDTLRTAETIRYAKLNTHNIESGHFRYHVSQLVNAGHVEQLERGLYGLTAQGKKYVDGLSRNTVRPAPMPKVITYTLLERGGMFLLQKKQKQPYMGLLNMIGGKLHEGETAEQATIREVYEKTHITITSPELMGIFEILISSNTGLMSHAIAYVFKAKAPADALDPTLTYLRSRDFHDAPDLAPDFLPIFEKLHNSPSMCIATLEITM